MCLLVKLCSFFDLGVRHVQVALIFFMVVLMYIIAMAPTVAIVAMTTPGTTPNPSIPTFPNWTYQSFILTAFYWGFAPLQIFGGLLSRKFGYKWFMVTTMVISSLTSIWLPGLVIGFGQIAVIISFFIQGLCQGLVMPMLSDFISLWVPIPERTTTGTMIFACRSLGTLIATETTGLLSSSWLGWPSIFYLNGLLGLVWSVIMVILGSDNPDLHEKLTQSELEYIKEGKNFTEKRVPWSKILRSGPTWAVWVSHITTVWTIRLSSVEFPTYIDKVLGFNVETTSGLVSFSNLVGFLVTFLLSSLFQYLINNCYLTVGVTRKISSTIGSWIPSFFLILLVYYHKNTLVSMCSIFVIFVCTNASASGFNINYNDLSPNYSGCLFGIGGVLATFICFLPTMIVQFMVTNETDAKQWAYSFWLAAVITSIGNIFFLLKGSGEVQDYDSCETNEDEEKRCLLDKSSQYDSRFVQ